MTVISKITEGLSNKEILSAIYFVTRIMRHIIFVTESIDSDFYNSLLSGASEIEKKAIINFIEFVQKTEDKEFHEIDRDRIESYIGELSKKAEEITSTLFGSDPSRGAELLSQLRLVN